jgi:phenylacetate-CoA ligase
VAGLGNRIYGHLPVLLQNVGVSLYGWRWRKRRFGGIFANELCGFKDRECFSAEQWREHQTVELRRLLLHAFETVPFYRRTYTDAGFGVDDFRSFELDDLKRLPYLEKDDLRKFGRSDLLSSRREAGGEFYASSGSTGTPTSILFSPAFHQRWSAAFEARIRHWAGLDRDMARGMIGGRRILPSADARPPYYRYNLFERQTYFSAYHISPTNAPNYLKGIRDNKVEYMNGYAMSNYFLARMFDELSLEAPELKAVVLSSEKLTPGMRAVFRRVYGCRTYDGYSGVEACGLISEHSSGELLSSPDVAVLEFLKEDGSGAAPGEAGEVVCTGLLNYDQPLIRYRIGDVVKLSDRRRSEAGLEMPVIDEIVGRVEDKVVGPDGREMVRFHGIFVDVPHLVSAQVVQEELEWLNIRAVTETGFGTSEEEIIGKRVRSQLGNIRVTIEQVDEIPRNANGKVPAVISKLKKQ